MPALLTRMRIGPTSSATSRASLAQLSASVTSSVKPRALPPSATIEIGDRARGVLVDVGDDHLGAGGGEAAGDRGTVAAAGAGHQGEASEQHVLHGFAAFSASRITASSPIWLTSSRISRASKARHSSSLRPLWASTRHCRLVRLAEVERASQRAVPSPPPQCPRRARQRRTAPLRCRTAASAPRRSGRAGSDRSCRAGRRSAWPPGRCILQPDHTVTSAARRRAAEAQQREIRTQPVDQPAVSQRRIDHRPARRRAARPSRRRYRACRAASRHAPSAPTAGRC